MIDIRFGNCHDIIKEMDDESVDMILTDPPYGISYQSSRRKVKAKPIYNDGDISWIDSLASEFYRVSKKTQLIMYFVVITILISLNWRLKDISKLKIF